MDDPFFTFLDENSATLKETLKEKLTGRSGVIDAAWIDVFVDHFIDSIKEVDGAGCLLAKKGVPPADSIRLLDETAFIMRQFLFEHCKDTDTMKAWTSVIDKTFIQLRHACLRATIPEALPALFSNTNLVTVLNRIGQRILQMHSEREIYTIIAEGLRELDLFTVVIKIDNVFQNGHFSYGGYDQRLKQALAELAEIPDYHDFRFSISEDSPMAACITQKTPMVFFPNLDLLKSLFRKNTEEKALALQKGLGSERTIVAPALVRGDLHSILAVSGNALVESDLVTIATFANQMAIALENANLYEDVHRRSEQLSVLNALAQMIIVEQSIEEILQQTMPVLHNLLPFDRISFMLNGEEGLRLYSLNDLSTQVKLLHLTNLEGSLFSKQIQNPRSRKIDDLRSIESKLGKMLEAEGIQSVLICPVVSRGKMLGTFNIGSRQFAKYSDEHLRIAQSIADQLAPLIDNAQLYTQVQRSEVRFRTFYQHAVVGIAVYDWQHASWDVNPAFLRMFGYENQKDVLLENVSIEDLRHPEDRHKDETLYADLMTGRVDNYQNESRFLTKDGRTIWAKTNISLVRDPKTSEALYTLALLEDITEKKTIEQAIMESEQKYRLLFELSVDAIFILDREGIIQSANTAALEMLGAQAQEVIGRTFISLFPEEEQKSFQLLGKSLLFLDVRHLEARFVTMQGKTLDIDLNTRAMESMEGALQVIARDVSEQKRIERELKYLGTHDLLTDLYNRNYFEVELKRLQNSRLFPVTMLMVDVDGLKQTNDIFGHAAGDQLLIRAAAVLKSAFRNEDVVARWGGDEFAVLLPLVDQLGAQQAEERLRRLVKQNNEELSGLPLSFSIGVATARWGEKLSETLRRADESMYMDKDAHRSAKKFSE